ncbi:MAG: hypothetical protein KF751_18620 [Nitrospira sp.]|nr:hypothetical protein [Nitrospira sp.]
MVRHRIRAFSTALSMVSLRHTSATMGVLLIALTLVGCNPEHEINDYFQQLGLTRLATHQTDVQPGTVILMKGHEAFLGDHILDYVDQHADPLHDYGMFGGSAKVEMDAVLRKLTANKELSCRTAMSFVVNLF